MKIRLTASLFVVGVSMGPSVFANCPIAQSYEVNCQGNGCSGSVTAFYCTGLGTGTTCGRQGCSSAITCCGTNVGYNTIPNCGSCAGCPEATDKTQNASVIVPDAGDASSQSQEAPPICAAKGSRRETVVLGPNSTSVTRSSTDAEIARTTGAQSGDER